MAAKAPPGASALAMTLSNAQDGDPDAQCALAEMPWIRDLVRARCVKHGVDPQEDEDVLQETLARLLDPKHQRFADYLGKVAGRARTRPARGKPRRPRPVGSRYGPPHDYVGGVVWNAIGVAKRRRRSVFHGEPNTGSAQPNVDGKIAAVMPMEGAVAMDGVASPGAMEARVAVREVLAAMPPKVRKLATAVYCEGARGTDFESDPEIAMDKVQVSRALARFRVEARLMLVA